LGDVLTKHILIKFATATAIMIPLERGNKVLDLGVWFDEKLSFSKHIQTKINQKTWQLRGIAT